MIIGFVGLTGSGKTEAAEIAKDYFSGEIIGFANSLKALIKALGLSYTRLSLVDTGTKCQQVLGRNVFANVIAPILMGAAPTGNNIFIDDVRFIQEIKLIKALGGHIIYLDAPKETLYQRTVDRKQYIDDNMEYKQFLNYLSTSRSELLAYNIDKDSWYIDQTIENNGSFGYLEKTLIKLILTLEGASPNRQVVQKQGGNTYA